MHPKFADRIARRLSVVKQRDGIEAVTTLANRVMGYCGPDHEDYKQVLACSAKYKGQGTVTDT